MAQFAADSFTGVDGTTLQVHSANWVEHTLSAGGDMIITANRLQQRVSGEGFYYHSGSPAGADYSVSSDFYVASYSPAFNATGVIGRTSTSANTFYHARHRVSGGWELYKRVTGTFTLLGSQTVSTPAALGTYNLKLDMVGSTIRLLADGIELVSAVDASITAAGKSGLRISNASAQTSSEGLHFDNFSADDAAASGSSAGSSSGTSTASGVGASVAESVSSASGLAAVSGVGSSVSQSTGSASGEATVSGVGDSILSGASVGTSAGVATANGVGASTASSTASASGIATVSGVGDSTSAGSSVGSASGSSSVTGVSASIAASTGSASGEATVRGVSDVPVVSNEFSGGYPYVSREDREANKKKQRQEMGILPPDEPEIETVEPVVKPRKQKKQKIQVTERDIELARLAAQEAERLKQEEIKTILLMLMDL